MIRVPAVESLLGCPVGPECGAALQQLVSDRVGESQHLECEKAATLYADGSCSFAAGLRETGSELRGRLHGGVPSHCLGATVFWGWLVDGLELATT